MCELTLLVTSITVAKCYQGWRNPEWTKCSVQCFDMYLYTFKLRFIPCTISGWANSVPYICVVDWFSNMCVPWIPAAKIMINDHSSVEFVVNQSLHYLIINLQDQILSPSAYSCFSLN